MERKEYETLYLEINEPVARLVLNRPEKLNAISHQMMHDREDALDYLEDQMDYRRDDALGIKVVVVEGEGRGFCTGYDLEEVTERFARGHDSIPIHDDFEHIRQEAWGWHRLWELSPVTIAKVHGYCLAGGLMVDLIVATEGTHFGQPEIKSIGFNPDLALWPFTIGLRKTKELLFTGDVITGEKAEAIDMINLAVPSSELDREVDDLVSDILDVDRDMLYYAKRMVNDVYENMGMSSMIRTGITYDEFGHLGEARARFKRLVQEKGLEEAIEEEFPSSSQEIKGHGSE
jgi:enoyl-CoA hydratase